VSRLRQIDANKWEYDVRRDRKTITFILSFNDGSSGELPLWWVTPKDAEWGFAGFAKTMDGAIEESHELAERG